MSDSNTAPKAADEPTAVAVFEETVAIEPAARGSKAAPADDGDDAASHPETRAEPKDAPVETEPVGGRTVSVKAIASFVVGLLVAAVLAVLIWLVVHYSSEADDLKTAAADDAHAEQIALDYATGAAQMSYEDTQGWLTRLTANTTPELGTRLKNAASQMEQLLRPLQWSSTSAPIAAKVMSVDGDVYQVDAFVGIVTKNVQAPADGIETTATYKLTIDKSQDWTITAITSNGTSLDAEGAQAQTPDAPAPATAPGDADVPAAPGN